jgi:hypothetical protein
MDETNPSLIIYLMHIIFTNEILTTERQQYEYYRLHWRCLIKPDKLKHIYYWHCNRPHNATFPYYFTFIINFSDAQ